MDLSHFLEGHWVNETSFFYALNEGQRQAASKIRFIYIYIFTSFQYIPEKTVLRQTT